MMSCCSSQRIGLDALPLQVQPHVAAGNRQTLFDEAGKESCLETTAQHWLSLKRVPPWGQDRAQPRGSSPPSTREDAIYLFDVEHAQDRRLLNAASHRIPSGLASHVDESSGWCGTWNLVANFNLLGQRQPHTVPANAGDLAT
jgi:hypothetical protein